MITDVVVPFGAALAGTSVGAVLTYRLGRRAQHAASLRDLWCVSLHEATAFADRLEVKLVDPTERVVDAELHELHELLGRVVNDAQFMGGRRGREIAERAVVVFDAWDKLQKNWAEQRDRPVAHREAVAAVMGPPVERGRKGQAGLRGLIEDTRAVLLRV